MMYLPKVFSNENQDHILKIIDEYPFMTLITGAEISHIPLVAQIDEGSIVLHGHMSKQSEHARVLDQGDSTIIVHGPHGYISSSWYIGQDVPTWNYIAIHMKGRAKLLKSEREILQSLAFLTKKIDSTGWKFSVPDDLKGKVSHAIIAFEIKIGHLWSKFKLSQNRDRKDIENVIQELYKSGNMPLAKWMEDISLLQAAIP